MPQQLARDCGRAVARLRHQKLTAGARRSRRRAAIERAPPRLRPLQLRTQPRFKSHAAAKGVAIATYSRKTHKNAHLFALHCILFALDLHYISVRFASYLPYICFIFASYCFTFASYLRHVCFTSASYLHYMCIIFA